MMRRSEWPTTATLPCLRAHFLGHMPELLRLHLSSLQVSLSSVYMSFLLYRLLFSGLIM